MISIALASPLVLFALPSEGSPLPPSRLARAEWIQLSPDDLPHLWLQHEDGRFGLFRWEDGSLTDASAEKGWDTTRAWAATAWGDADGDDLPDLLALRTDGVVSWWSNRAGVLEEVPQELIADPALRFSEVSWVDVDADGRDEMWLFGQRPLLLRIDGSSSPTPVPLELAATPTITMRGAGGRPATTPAAGSIAAAPDAARPRFAGLPTQLPGPGEDPGPAALVEGPDGEPVFDALEASPLAAFDAFCLETIADQASNACLLASSQPLLGALYPLSLDFNLDADGRVGIGTTSPTEARLHVLEDPLSGDAIHAETAVGGAAALTAISSNASNGFGIKAEANSGVGRAVRGVNEAAGGNGIGVEGVSRSNTGRAVTGVATNPTGPNFGVFGETLSANGTGVMGQASSLSGASVGVRGVSDSTDLSAIGVEGVGPTGVRGEGSLFGVFGTTPGLGWGVVGEAQGLGTGVVGESAQGTGVSGATQGTDAVAITGTATNSSSVTVGVRGNAFSPQGAGVFGSAGTTTTLPLVAQGTGVFGLSDREFKAGVTGNGVGTSGMGIYGVYDPSGAATTFFSGGSGVSGATVEVDAVGVAGFSQATTGAGIGVFGNSDADSGVGVSGQGAAVGTSGSSTAGVGVLGEAIGGTGVRGSSQSGVGVEGIATGSDDGVVGTSDSGSGVAGSSAAGRGVEGSTTTGTGVYAVATDSSGTGAQILHTNDGVALSVSASGEHMPPFQFSSAVGIEAYGDGPHVIDVFAGTSTTVGIDIFSHGQGIVAEALGGTAISGLAEALGSGVYGDNSTGGFVNTAGVHGTLSNGTPGAFAAGVRGEIFSSTTGNAYGVHGKHAGSGIGVYGESASGTGVFASGSSFALDTDGDVRVIGDLNAIGGDQQVVHPHPSDPSKEIRFSSLVSNEPGTLFRGRARLQGGRLEVEVPESFRLVTEAEGLTVQLTPLGQWTRLWAERLDLDRLVLRGDADVEVSYLVHGIRAGFAGQEAIVENHHFVPSFADVPFGRAMNEATRSTLVRTGILEADGTPSRVTAERMGWSLKSGPKTSEPGLGVPESRSATAVRGN